MSVVYLSGPITGIENYNTAAFATAEMQHKDQGHVVLNPRRLPLGLTYQAYMDIAMAQVRAAEVIYRLPGWSNSKGARAEVAYAQSLGKYITGAEA